MANVKKRSKAKKKKIESDIYLYIYAILLVSICLFGVLKAGPIGVALNATLKYLVGELSVLVFFVGIIFGFILVLKKTAINFVSKHFIGLGLILIAWLMLMAVPIDPSLVGFSVLSEFMKNTTAIMLGEVAYRGGLIGTLLYALVSLLVARVGTYIVIMALFILAFFIILSIDTYRSFIIKGFEFLKLPTKYLKEHEIKRAAKLPKPVKTKEIAVEEELDSSQNTQKLFDLKWNDDHDDVVMEKTDLHHFMNLDDTFVDAEVEDIPLLHESPINVSEQKTSSNSEKPESIDEAYQQALSEVESHKVYELPLLALLDSSKIKNDNKSNVDSAKANGVKVVDILSQFGVSCELIDVHIGPSVTKFEIKPALGVRVNKIASLQDDIKMALSAKDIRIEAPIPGKNAVGIEIPNVKSSIVKMHDMLANIPPKLNDKKLLVALGKDISGQPVYGELDKMPHLLVAGATGSGKSVCMNAIITSLLMRCTPDDCKLVLIDPKRVEFTAYHQLPHLIAPVISDAKEASKALKVVVSKMEDRYEIFSEVGVRNITGYNEMVAKNAFKDSRKPMPYIVVIIDELADLMMVAAKEVEASIQRITQLARAAGIHLIVATQRPSVDVITGIIKANIPSRIAFAVSSSVDSRTILDHVGAERLLGYGDMLYIPMGEPSASRVQGAYVSDEEVKKITDFVKEQGLPCYDAAFKAPETTSNGSDGLNPNSDPMYAVVKEYVIGAQKASTSLLQRRFGIGYNRAARLVDLLEENGVIGPNNGAKPREVYLKPIEGGNEDE